MCSSFSNSHINVKFDDNPIRKYGCTDASDGTSNMVFTVTLSEPLTHSVSVQFSTADNTAKAPDDYLSRPLSTLSLDPGQTSKMLFVTIVGDTLDEENETFFLDLRSAVGASITDSRGVGRITDDVLPPALSISDAPAVGEGNPPTTTNATFNVTLSAASGKPVSVKVATADGTARAPGDYTALPLTTLTFAPGETTKPVSVTVKGDLLDEADEPFLVNLSSPVNATIADGSGTGMILDDDGPSIVINNSASVTEGDSGTVNAVFTVTLSAPSLQSVTVNFATADFTATAGEDYTAKSGTLTFAPGETSKTIVVAVNGDTLVEGNEAFMVNLSNPTNGVILDGQGGVFILDDDGAALLFDEPSE